MKVSELITALEHCDPDAKLELYDGSPLDDICYNPTLKRVCFSAMDDRIKEENLGEGWVYLIRFGAQE